MSKKKNKTPPEERLLLPPHPSRASSPLSTGARHTSTVDTHTHLLSTFTAYQETYKPGKHETIWEFVRGMYEGRSVEAIVDVWCESPPLIAQWKELADSALESEQRKEKWAGIEYWFVMGVHPHESKDYTDAVERDIIEAMSHPRCVGWGEIGLDYHYDNSLREHQQDIFTRQLRLAVRLGKPLTIHTREAEEDTERILKAEVPREHRIHIHCFTDSPEWAARMLAHFPNLYIGITGVITYATNLNTSAVIRQMVASTTPPISTSTAASTASTTPSPELSTPAPVAIPDSALRIVLETDAPYMVPVNLYNSVPEIKNKRLPLCHTAMLPWTAEFVARVANEATGTSDWDVERIMRIARDNARKMYGI